MIYHVEIAGKGGITQYTFNLVQHLAQTDSPFEFAIVGAKQYELQDSPRNFRLIPVFNRFKTNPIKLLSFFLFKVKKNDMVHFQLSAFPPFILSIILLLKLFKRPRIVVTAHNVVSHETNFWTKHILLAIYRLADRVIVHARQNKEEMISLFKQPEEKITVIPHGNYLFVENFDVTAAQNGAPPKDKNNKFEILFFGYIRKYKGLEYLLRALNIVTETHKNVILNIAGKPYAGFEEYQKLIDELSLRPFVTLHLDYIPIQQVQRFFSSADVVALPYKRISQSGVIFLAYAFAKPVVASAIGGIPEVVEDGKSGLLVPPEDPQALADALIKLIEHPDLLRNMGRYNKQLSMEKFSWSAIAKKTVALYESLISG